jgi:phage/plasmid-associated DNA primase
MVLISEQGTGKGFFLNFMRYILRNVNMCEVVGINSITQKHNTIMERKRLAIINEMSSTRDEFKTNFDKIKVYITDPYITIEPKGVNAYQIENITNLILCSNHQDSIIVESGDRRYTIFEVNDKYKGNKKYFDKLAELCFNQEVANAFYTYLLNFDCLDDLKPIETELRTQAINLSKHNSLKFIDHITENPIMTGFPEEEPLKFIKSTDLYNHYKQYCIENGERNVASSRKFGLTIKNQLEKRRMNTGVHYVLPIVNGAI